MNCKILKFFCISFFILNTAQANAFDWFDDDDDKNEGRSYIHIVGSSTISPLMASVSEEFARNHAAKGLIIETPVVESTGTIEGIKIFCGGLGKNHPDFVSASRPINGEEVKQCNENGVKEIAEIKIGYDGIVLVNLIGNPKINLTTEQIFWALAKRVVDKKTGKLIKNPYENWSDIDPSLPNKKIVVYGPPATSGTRDIFIDIVMTGICFSDSRLAALYPDEHTRKEKCAVLRSDGHFIESGENDSLILQSLKEQKDALAIVGFDFLVLNKKLVQPVKIDGVSPEFSTISSKKYSLSRPLFVYFKKEQLTMIPRMSQFIKELISKETVGRKGYLVHSGLVPLNDKEVATLEKNIGAIIE